MRQFDYKTAHEYFGNDPKSFGWPNLYEQNKRFEILSKILSGEKEFSVLDVGAGMGHYYKYLKDLGYDPEYLGVEREKFFVDRAKEQNAHVLLVDFYDMEPDSFDYVICSGTFNTQGTDLLRAIPKMIKFSRKGTAFNFIMDHNPGFNVYKVETIQKLVESFGYKPSFISGYVLKDCTCLIPK